MDIQTKTPSWDHFNDNFLSQSVENLTQEKTEEYKNIGDRYLGYDIDNIESVVDSNSVMLNSNGKQIKQDDEYNILQILKCIKSGLNISDLTEEEVKLLSNHANTEDKKKLQISIYNNIKP